KNFISPGFNQKEETFDLRNTHIKSNIDDYLYKGILSYFKSRLTAVTVNVGSKTYYTNKRSIEMSEAGLGDRLTTLQV
ncbi:hypothetical protein LR010_00995, partial [Candidatus Gracilibacteria bacterium]|nr:hypothetical protein [Candidatus Gracilibacteria bacterium]